MATKPDAKATAAHDAMTTEAQNWRLNTIDSPYGTYYEVVASPARAVEDIVNGEPVEGWRFKNKDNAQRFIGELAMVVAIETAEAMAEPVKTADPAESADAVEAVRP